MTIFPISEEGCEKVQDFVRYIARDDGCNGYEQEEAAAEVLLMLAENGPESVTKDYVARVYRHYRSSLIPPIPTDSECDMCVELEDGFDTPLEVVAELNIDYESILEPPVDHDNDVFHLRADIKKVFGPKFYRKIDEYLDWLHTMPLEYIEGLTLSDMADGLGLSRQSFNYYRNKAAEVVNDNKIKTSRSFNHHS